MLNRRLIRIKAFKVLYSSVCSSSTSLRSIEEELLHACEETRRLYYFMLQLPVALSRLANERIELGLKKFQPTEEEKNPNRKFADNALAAMLRRNDIYMTFCESQGLLWDGEQWMAYVKKLFARLLQEEYFQKYMASPTSSLREDCALFSRIYQQEFEDDEDLEQMLEDASLYWVDDLGYVLNVILRTLSIVKSKEKLDLPPLFMKDDDRDFARELLVHSFAHYNEYLEMVKNNISNWDLDRLVVTDITLIIMGIAEAIRFDSIPVKVTINEYVEVSKFYSTQNSKVFVNGLLDRLIRDLQAKNVVVKRGAGLVEN
ncbi:MAG: transcription antitermination protein NusB [Bacteroidales bacterium]|nr:transcription antitermination protein NusB [Bacteroidales bacterium]